MVSFPTLNEYSLSPKFTKKKKNSLIETESRQVVTRGWVGGKMEKGKMFIKRHKASVRLEE